MKSNDTCHSHIKRQHKLNMKSNNIIEKVNARIQLLRQLKNLGITRQERIRLWIKYFRSIWEKSFVNLKANIYQQNINALEGTSFLFAS